jgi:ABC-2 type transport system permease protein
MITPTELETGARASATMPGQVVARQAGFTRDLLSVATRSLRQVRREPETLVPPLIIPVFFFAVFVGALQAVASHDGISHFRAFQLPVAIVFAVTGTTRATALVNDITNGYFDRLLISPTNRFALLLGLMICDLIVVVLLSIPVLALGFLFGVRFATGLPGVLAFIAIAALWGLAFAGIPYAIALRTGNSTVVAQSSLLFFPFVFLTTTLVPQARLTGWLAAVAHVNPVTYLLAALRSLITDGWSARALAEGLGIVAVVAVVTFSLALIALRGRVSRA